MNKAFLSACLSGLSFLFTAACNTAPTAPPATAQTPRIAEYKADFEALPPETRQEIAAGLISRGQNMKLVYMALGRPDRITSSPDAKTITWSYRNYLPPVPKGEKAPEPKNVREYSAINDPLMDTFDAWTNGQLRHQVESDPKVVARAPGQSWADYGKYRRDREMARDPDIVKILDQQARANSIEAQKISPIPELNSVKLDVIFVDQLVSNAIADDSFSAFSQPTAVQ